MSSPFFLFCYLDSVFACRLPSRLMYLTFLSLILILIPHLESLLISSATMSKRDITAPTITPSGANFAGNRWCVARDNSSEMELQAALDYACGIGEADCSDIQPDGRCYVPRTVRHHASYAFSDYYKKNPVPESCDFGGVAVVTSIDPSSKTCQYSSTPTSMTMTILNVTNLNSSTIFGTRPSPETPTSYATTYECRPMLYLISIISAAAALHFELLLLCNKNRSP